MPNARVATVRSRSRPELGALCHHVRAGRLTPERRRGQRVGADVECEDLQHAEREREPPARQCPDHEGRQLCDVVGEVIGEEAAGVGERCPTLLDGRHDGGEVVVEQHEIRRFPRHVAAAGSHGDADVGLSQRRSVVDTVARHRDHVPSHPQRPCDPELVLGGDPGDHHAVTVDERSEQLLVIGQFGTDQDEPVRRPKACLVGDGRGGERRVAGDHRHADTRSSARGERVAGFESGRVLEGKEPE